MAFESSRSVREWQIVEHAGSGCAWHTAPEAVEFAWAAAVSMAAAGRIEKGAEFCAMDKRWALGIDRRKARFEPAPDRVFVDANTTRSLLDGIASMDLDMLTTDTSHRLVPDSIRARISATFHAVIRLPSFTGCGKRPLLTPAHHVDLATGIGPLGARIEDSRINPVSGRPSDMNQLHLLPDEVVLSGSIGTVGEFRNGLAEFRNQPRVLGSSMPRSRKAIRRCVRTVSSWIDCPSKAMSVTIFLVAGFFCKRGSKPYLA